MGFSLETSIPVLTVFVQGLLSFFSPCVLPLIPLYVGYLAGGAGVANDDGTVEYPRKKVFVNTLFFVVGVSFAFFLLGFGFTALGQFFTGNQRVFSIVAGVIMAAFGLYMLGAFGKTKAVEKERRLPFRLYWFAMNPLVALVLGFTFSFVPLRPASSVFAHPAATAEYRLHSVERAVRAKYAEGPASRAWRKA